MKPVTLPSFALPMEMPLSPLIFPIAVATAGSLDFSGHASEDFLVYVLHESRVPRNAARRTRAPS